MAPNPTFFQCAQGSESSSLFIIIIILIGLTVGDGTDYSLDDELMMIDDHEEGDHDNGVDNE